MTNARSYACRTGGRTLYGTGSVRPNKPTVRTPSERASDAQLIKTLEAHVETLKQQLGAAEAQTCRRRRRRGGRNGRRQRRQSPRFRLWRRC